MHETESPAPANVVLTRDEAAFLAARLRRLFDHFGYPVPHFTENDASMIRVAGSCIGGLLLGRAPGVAGTLPRGILWCNQCGEGTLRGVCRRPKGTEQPEGCVAYGVAIPQRVQCEAGHAPRGLCEFGPFGWRGVVVCKHCKQAPPDGVEGKTK